MKSKYRLEGPATQRQLDLLVEFGVKHKLSISKKDASALISNEIEKRKHHRDAEWEFAADPIWDFGDN